MPGWFFNPQDKEHKELCFLCRVGADCNFKSHTGQSENPNFAHLEWYESKCNNCGVFALSPGGYYSLKDASRSSGNNKYFKNKYCLSAYSKRQEVTATKPPLFHSREELVDKEILKFISGEIYQPIVIQEKMDYLSKFTILDRLDWAIQNLCELSGSFGGRITKGDTGYPLLFAEDEDRLGLMLSHLINDRQYLEGNLDPMRPGTKILELTSNLLVTVKGWERYEEIKRRTPNQESRQGFVAMPFVEELNSVFENGIKKAIEDAGYETMRVDQHEHVNKICDEIIAQIRKSRFLVADFTSQNQGVYFEAGYAMALEIPVIWTCKKDELEDLHFDTQQYSHIPWENEKDLYKKLKARIQAVIG